jgi:hypothetical protein
MANKTMIVGKLDCTKILKEHLFSGKNGAKYLDIVLIETPDNRFGDNFMITQSLPKSERDKGVRGPILGNAKYLGGAPGTTQPTHPTAGSAAASPDPIDDPDQVPF